GDIVQFMHSALGDIRVKGVYTGFSPDMSSGITFGLKLPTGDHKFRNFDRDTSIGTGSTDVLLGAYHVGHPGDNWSWFVNGEAQQSVLITPNYRPGSDVNVSIGGYFNGRRVRGVTIVPLAQVIGSQRWSDTGEDSDHPNTGYRRLVLSPGVEFDFSSWRLYADVGFPVYQYVNGNQLVATAFYKVVVGRSFR
ncbi:MAG: hypothetical protein JO102_04390, partial [Elusimicrobia bacterium]|nr:hypothetical protein [Elusimicrobiota bacterium]